MWLDGWSGAKIAESTGKGSRRGHGGTGGTRTIKLISVSSCLRGDVFPVPSACSVPEDRPDIEETMKNSITIFGDHEPKTLAQLKDVASRAERTALMADGHLGYVMPIGGVAAYKNQVSVVGVGFDIACGNAAIRTDLTLHGSNGIQDRLSQIADEIQEVVSFGIGRKNRADDAPVDHPLFKSESWQALPRKVEGNLRDKARAQLGTVGSGNHYVDVFADEADTIWVGVHFGSRGFGHTVASGFLAMSQGEKWGARVPEREALLPLDAPMGQDYWALMTLAGEYAYAGREWVARKVVALLGGRELELVHNHHNFAWREEHDGESVIVVRKGATPAFPGQKGFVGGSMGDDAVIVRGTVAPGTGTEELQRKAMYSTVHGAGRVMSRTQAAGKRNWRTGKVLSPGAVSPEMMGSWVRTKGVILRGGGLDESPHVYRRLPDVLAAQKGTIDVLHTLRPLVVVMAGADLFDPYKD
jgi:tRNA-splicing ligase RtcB (3'-phosphate/5'-hydroxy nucleic acid ligase)